MKAVFYCAIVSLLSVQALGQGGEFGELIKGTASDANYLAKGYMSPMLRAFGSGLNQGWYNTAKTHKKLGFDLTFSVAAVSIPSSHKFFTVDNSRFESLDLTKDHDGFDVDPGTGTGRVPTVFGPSSTKSEYRYRSPLNTATVLNGAPGFDLKDAFLIDALPVPVANLSIGLPKNIELKFRYIPEIKSKDVEFNYFGVGLMHDVKQYIRGIKRLPFDLSAFAGHTRLNLSIALNPDDPSQTGELKLNSTTIQALVSKKVSVLTVYGAAGYDFTKATLQTKGSYDLNGISGDGEGGSNNEAINPVDINVMSSGPRLTAGMRLKLWVFTLHGDYTLQKYNVLTVGFGINVR